MPIDFRQKVDAAQAIVFNGESMGATFESAVISMLYFKSFLAQFTFTGAPVGSFKIEVSGDISNDYSEVAAATYADVTRWDPYPDSTVAISAAGTIVYDIVGEFNAAFIKFTYTRTSGTGSMYGTITKKS